MTPTRQAACATFVGFTLALLGVRGQGQEAQPFTQAPAPVIRVTPRPRTPSPAQASTAPSPATTPATRRPMPRPATAAPARNPASSDTTEPRVIVRAAPPGTPAPEHKALTLSTTGLNRNVIVLDPAHGGTDSGARIGDTTLEKNVTLAFAFRLRSLLIARGFTVLLTRDSDAATEPNTPSTPLTLDDRAGIANHARAAACLLLHATGRGNGVHLYSSELEPAPAEASLLPWLTAQAAWVPASQVLEQQLGAALGRSHIALVSSTASVRPEDSLTCPALIVELAPEDDTTATINDAGYQERVAAAIAGALVFWQNAVQPPVKLPPPPSPHAVRREEPGAAVEPEAQP